MRAAAPCFLQAAKMQYVQSAGKRQSCSAERRWTAIVGGNPARFIRKRFDDELIELLLQWKWWDLTPEQLVDALPILCNPDLEEVKKQIQSF